jgi:RNA polymerase sigma factor (sigma-70 family)
LNVEVYDAQFDGKDYLIQFKVKNAHLMRALRMRGYRSATQFAMATKDISPNTICDYLALRRAPLNKKGNWNKSALAMARTLRLPVDSLFPQNHLDAILRKNSGEFEASREELVQLVSPPQTPEDALISDEMYDCVHKALSTLKPRHRKVLEQRFGIGDGPIDPQSLRDIGNTLGVTQERARQMEAIALRQLKHPDVSRTLLQFIQD